MKIFAIGLNKTGTTSLHHALKTLGFRSLHDWQRCSEIAEFASAGRRHPLLDEYDAFLDGKLHQAYRPSAQWYPKAAFILTKRDKKAWIMSRINHVLFNRASGESTWREISTRYWSKQWDEHYRQVDEFFYGTDRCLKIDVCGGDGWKRLCPFLEKAVPPKPFPMANGTKEKFERLEKCPCCRRAFPLTRRLPTTIVGHFTRSND